LPTISRKIRAGIPKTFLPNISRNPPIAATIEVIGRIVSGPKYANRVGGISIQPCIK
jgi:hypothetical protein